MTDKKRNPENIKLVGGRLCLDFVNTLDWRGTDHPQEFLNSYNDLILWCRHVGICTHQESKHMCQFADRSANDAKMVLNRAVKLRETIYRLFSAKIDKKDPANADLVVFNKNLARSMRESKITKLRDGYTWDINGNKMNLDWILNPIIRSAADVLVSNELNKVKACADLACGWLFMDVSRNQSRRWCDMKDCGNRAKASRFYNKKRTGK